MNVDRDRDAGNGDLLTRHHDFERDRNANDHATTATPLFTCNYRGFNFFRVGNVTHRSSPQKLKFGSISSIPNSQPSER